MCLSLIWFWTGYDRICAPREARHVWHIKVNAGVWLLSGLWLFSRLSLVEGLLLYQVVHLCYYMTLPCQTEHTNLQKWHTPSTALHINVNIPYKASYELLLFFLNRCQHITTAEAEERKSYKDTFNFRSLDVTSGCSNSMSEILSEILRVGVMHCAI